MKTRTRQSVVLATLAVASALVASGCATRGSDVPIPETVTVDLSNTNRVRFVVHGDPGLKKYPEINALAMPMHDKIREAMRRHAADLLVERGLCPHGFVGPEAVLASENARLTSRFWVECLP